MYENSIMYFKRIFRKRDEAVGLKRKLKLDSQRDRRRAPAGAASRREGLAR